MGRTRPRGEAIMSDPSKKKKTRRTWILVAVAVAVAGFVGYRWWQSRQSALPKGIASGNGRIESKLVDVAAKEPLRVKEVLVAEGDLVKPNQVLVRLDTVTVQAEAKQATAALSGAGGKPPVHDASGPR